MSSNSWMYKRCVLHPYDSTQIGSKKKHADFVQSGGPVNAFWEVEGQDPKAMYCVTPFSWYSGNSHKIETHVNCHQGSGRWEETGNKEAI